MIIQEYIPIKNQHGVIIGGYNEYHDYDKIDSYQISKKIYEKYYRKKNKEIKNMNKYHIQNGHEYIKVFRRREPVKNQQYILQDDEYYYYSDYYEWRHHTKFHIGDIILFNSGVIGIGTLGVIANKSLQFHKGTWQEIKNQNISYTEYSYDSFEVYYQAIKADGNLMSLSPINCFATLDNVSDYFNELLKRKEKIESYNTNIGEIERERDICCESLKDFEVNGSYDMLYERPYEGDEYYKEGE